MNKGELQLTAAESDLLLYGLLLVKWQYQDEKLWDDIPRVRGLINKIKASRPRPLGNRHAKI